MSMYQERTIRRRYKGHSVSLGIWADFSLIFPDYVSPLAPALVATHEQYTKSDGSRASVLAVTCTLGRGHRPPAKDFRDGEHLPIFALPISRGHSYLSGRENVNMHLPDYPTVTIQVY